MKKPLPWLLTIQKFIYLLDDFHYHEFIHHLSLINATLPLKLSKAIREKLPAFDTHEDLCKKVYGSFGKAQKQNFNQLSSYTFKLSAALAQNYPSYLNHNISKIETLVNAGKKNEANFEAEALLDIAGRVESFQCWIFTLQFFCQQAIFTKDAGAEAIKLNEQLEAVVELEKLFIQIQASIRKTLHLSMVPKTSSELEKLKDYYQQYHAHASPSIRIISQYAYLDTVYNYDPKMLSDADMVKIEALEKEIQNYAYLVFPFMSDIKGNLLFFKLNPAYYGPESKKGQKDFEELSKHYDSLKFWNSYVNAGQINLVAIQSTRLLLLYQYSIHRPDYYKVIADKDLKLAKNLVQQCNELLGNVMKEKHHQFDEVNIRMLRGALLIIAGGENIKKGIRELESLLTDYQQVNLKSTTISIFLCLMIGYFSLKDYAKCAHIFKRYLKIKKNKLVLEGNDVLIYQLYYISQWLATKSRQYPAKLQALQKQYKGPPAKGLLELINYFQIPSHL